VETIFFLRPRPTGRAIKGLAWETISTKDSKASTLEQKKTVLLAEVNMRK